MAAPEQLPSQVGSALDELRATLDRAAELAKEIGSRPESAAELSARLADVQSDRDELSTKLAEYEQQVGRLMNLYVATYQLHATLDPGEVQATIAEIAINLLGAERFVLLFWKNDGDEASGECEVAFAQGWCTNQRPEAARLQAQTNPHSTAQWRVNGPVSDNPDFAKAFACQAGAAMAPQNRCTVW